MHFKKDSKQGAKSFWGRGPWTSQGGNWGVVNVINNIEHIYEMFEELIKMLLEKNEASEQELQGIQSKMMSPQRANATEREKWLSGKGTCWASIKTQVQISSIDRHVCNSSSTVGRGSKIPGACSLPS